MTEQKLNKQSVILALDQSTSCTGYCVFVNNQKRESGIITPDHTDKKTSEDFILRINNMGEKISQLVQQYKPTVVVLEDIQFQKNYGTYKRLANLQGVIFAHLHKQQTPFLLVEVTRWKSFLGVKSRGRENQKKETIEKIKEIYNLEKVYEDEADAIGIGHWAINNVVITPL